MTLTPEATVAGADRPRVFYGWVMAPIAVLAQACTLPAQSAGVSVFNESFRADLSISASQLSGAYALGTILASLVLPLFGILQDRKGIRFTLGLVAILLCGACQLISLANSLLVLFIGFFCLRLVGQGALSLTSSSIMSMWFRRRLGTVAGVTSLAITAVMAFGPLAIVASIDRWGWRVTYRNLGWLVVLVLLPALLPFRNRPEDVGQLPDGETRDVQTPSEFSDSERLHATTVDVPYKKAIRTSSFWILVAMSVIWSMICTALIFDVQPLAASRHATLWQPAIAITIFFMCVATMRLFGGWLADRIALPRLLSVASILLFVAVLIFLLGRGNWFFVGFGVCGFSQGLMMAVGSTVWVRYYGRTDFGKIRSCAMMAMVIGSSLGPLVVGFGVDWTGSYDVPFFVFAVVAVAAYFASRFLKAPAESVLNLQSSR